MIIISDGNTGTWQPISVTLTLPVGTTHLDVAAYADENVVNDTVSPEFAGHYVDGVALTVTIAPDIQVEQPVGSTLVDNVSTVNFGTTPLGTPVTRTFRVTNTGGQSLNVTGITLSSGYEHVGTFTPYSLAPNATQSFDVRFLANTVTGTLNGTMTLTSDDPDAEGSFALALTGQASNPFGNPGSLDLTFDADGAGGAPGGKVITSVGNYESSCTGVAVQSDGKIVLAGSAGGGSNSDLSVVRYHVDGTLDSSFGIGGKVITPIGSGADAGRSLVIQGDGKIMVAGYSHNGSNIDFAVVRYNANGTLDSSFGTGGKVTTPIGSGSDIVYSIALQGDAKIVVGGTSTSIDGINNDFAMVRYNANGTLDTSFGASGKVTTAIGSDDLCTGVVIQSDGKIVLAGYCSISGSYNFASARYNTDGTLDSSFGTGGKVTTTVGSGGAVCNDIALQSDGKIVVAGYASIGGGNDFAVVRYNTNGTLDNSFGTGGKVTTNVVSEWDYGRSLVVQNDGKIVVAGYASNTGSYDFASVRYNTDGTLDSSFGTGGKVTTDFTLTSDFYASDDYGSSVALQSDGKIIVGGDRGSVAGYRAFAVARYNIGGELTATVNTQAATSAGITTATLNGTVNPNGVITNAWFEYGPTTSYGSTTSIQPIGYGTSTVPVSANLTGLTLGTQYHYRLVAQNGSTTAYGSNMTFTTLTPYQAWAAANGVTGTNTGPNDDFDSDGVVNQLEWAFGMNPTVSGTGVIVVTGGVITQHGSPTVSIDRTNGFAYKALFGRRKDWVAAGLTFTVQFSGDLTNWFNSAATPTVIADDGEVEAVTVPYPLFVGGKKAQFYQVVVGTGP